MPSSHSDVLIVGGGVIGLTTALHLSDQGVSVTVVDRQQVGQEASWAGAGMLPPGTCTEPGTEDTPAAQERYLRGLSHAHWADFSARLLDQTGIDNGYRNCGALEVAGAAGYEQQVAAWRQEGILVESLDARDLLEQRVPGLHSAFASAVWLPEFSQVRNPRHIKAVLTACQLSGVEILEGVEGLQLDSDGDRIRVSCPSMSLNADRICVTAGAWSRQLLAPLGLDLPVTPVRGQVVQLRLPQLPFRCVIEQGPRYLVPRPDGLILAASTEDHVGFDRRTTGRGVSELLELATSLVPELGEAEVVRQWAGLRPGSPHGVPYLGQVTPWENLFLGAGHFRSGLQMSPATAILLTEMLTGASPAAAVELPGAEHSVPFRQGSTE